VDADLVCTFIGFVSAILSMGASRSLQVRVEGIAALSRAIFGFDISYEKISQCISNPGSIITV
jgi:hypothetical protein